MLFQCGLIGDPLAYSRFFDLLVALFSDSKCVTSIVVGRLRAQQDHHDVTQVRKTCRCAGHSGQTKPTSVQSCPEARCIPLEALSLSLSDVQQPDPRVLTMEWYQDLWFTLPVSLALHRQQNRHARTQVTLANTRALSPDTPLSSTVRVLACQTSRSCSALLQKDRAAGSCFRCATCGRGLRKLQGEPSGNSLM